MVKTLRITLVALLALVANVSFAQKVTLDFTSNEGWNFPTSDYTKDEGTFTKDGYSVVLKGGTAGKGYKYNEY